jgi:uncharacterized membrane protein YphA (DoxX/SURF4 family)
MLSVFPYLLSFQSLSPFIIRLTLGGVFLYWSFKAFSKKRLDTQTKTIALLESLTSLFLVVGLWTQVASLIIVIDLLSRLYFKFKNKQLFSDGVNYYFILLVLAVSLLFSGAGFLAFDLAL